MVVMMMVMMMMMVMVMMMMMMLMVMMVASCTIDFFIKMTICHFPQFLCSMSVPPHSLTIHTAHRAPCVAPGRAVLLQGAGVYGRMYCRAARCIAPGRVYCRAGMYRRAAGCIAGQGCIGHQTFPVGTGINHSPSR